MKAFGTTAVVAIGLLLVASCGNESAQPGSDGVKVVPLTAATLGDQEVLQTAEYLELAQFADADRKNGARQAQICKACHTFDEGAPHMIGPALYGMFGSVAGKQAGYQYSAALGETSFVWTPRALDAWLAQPGRFLPGNKMTFGGVSKPSDRDSLIAYLLEATSGGPNAE